MDWTRARPSAVNHPRRRQYAGVSPARQSRQLHSVPQATSSIHDLWRSPTETRSSSRISPIPRAIRCSTTRCVKRSYRSSFEQSPFLGPYFRQTKSNKQQALMGQTEGGATELRRVAQQICERIGEYLWLLEGSIASLWHSIRAGPAGRGTASPETRLPDQEQVQVARREDVLNALSQIAREF